MHEHDDYEVVNKGGSSFSAFFWGALIGAGIALLTAPRKGEETRQMLKERQHELMDKANDLAVNAREKAVEKVDQVKTRAVELQTEATEKGRSLVEQAKETARNYVATAAERTEEVAGDVKRAANGEDEPLKDDQGLVLTNSEKDFPL